MDRQDRVTPAQEYVTLRDELSQSKKYVFERPLAIAGVGGALLTAQDVRYGAAVPALLAGLLLFNYWFTINRMKSASRIVAYIQVALEGDVKWRGWETSLRKYRIWLKDDSKAKNERLDRELSQKAAPDALMYYPPIFLLHVALVVLAVVVGVVVTVEQPNLVNIAATIVLVLLTGVFVLECWKCRPGKMKLLVERNIAIWQQVLGARDH